MKFSNNYNFKKPEYTDIVDIQNINENTDALDANIKRIDDSNTGIVNGTIKTNAQALQGKAISATAPTTGQVMCSNGTQWIPKTLGAATVIVSGSFNFSQPLNYSQSATNFRYIVYSINYCQGGGSYAAGENGFIPTGILPAYASTFYYGPTSGSILYFTFTSTSVNVGYFGGSIYTPYITVWGVS